MGIKADNSKKYLIIKLFFLIVPFIAAGLYFWIPSGSSSGIGGGYYDLSLLYYFFLIIPYIILYGIMIGINSAFLKYKKGIISNENKYILIIGFILLVVHILYFFIVFK
ncbi:hypothetical protein [Flavobacterium sp. H122]|uniref:hypothetical protein n=1 Tax=Flavobacterium sp. H122 TaxID=2529860 RepID=UPI0010AA960B|nr:hypothetical protein [Flavobacterium sp. H122]